MLTSEIMTSDVVMVGPEAHVHAIAALLNERRISAVPVVAGGQVLGLVTEGDLLRRAELGTAHAREPEQALSVSRDKLARKYVREHGQSAVDVITRDVVTVEHDADVADIANLLERRRIKRVPVLKSGHLVGIKTKCVRKDLGKIGDEDLALHFPDWPPVL